MNNEPGSMEDYPDWMMRPEICPDTGYFLCRICGTLRGTAGSFNAHRIRKHGHIRHKMKCPIGHDTCAKQVNMEKLRQHLLKDHDFESVLEKRSFACKDDFLKWKGEIELSTNAHFIRKFFVRGANDYYSCNRSGDCESQVRRYAKKRGEEKEEESLATAKSPVNQLRGTGKMGAHCPATITVHYDDAGKAFVEAYLTHVGHELDVRHLPLPKGLRERVRNLLRLGKDTNEVLRILESEAVPGDRTSMVTARLVQGIRRLDQEGMNAGHLDANYLLVQPELVVERKPSEEWLVQSSKDHRQFSVTKSELGCPNEECHIRCHHCKICPHMYSCSCVRPPQSAHLPCMHIHGVHFLRERHALHTHLPAENFDIPFKRSRTNISAVKAREQYTAVHSPLEHSTVVHSPLEHSTAVHFPLNQEITVSDTNDGCVVDEIASPTNDDSSDNEHGESSQATMMASQKMVEDEVAVAGPSLDSSTERVAANEVPAVPNKKTVAALRELNALEKRLVLKIELYVLKPEEGGSKRPIANFFNEHVYSLTWDTGCLVTLNGKDFLMPGDAAEVQLQLAAPMFIEPQQRFTLRMEGKTIGTGV
uniref:Translation elongation factor EFTu/EF1A C-terminal domain-containing protein n=1 Tax=Plectus sambesii TaxID=2011161 RepID=A0A914WP37_9BILA